LAGNLRICPANSTWREQQIYADPVFCDPDADDYTLATNSPALTGPTMGAFPEPGCPPDTTSRPLPIWKPLNSRRP